MRVSQIRVNQIRVNQGLGVITTSKVHLTKSLAETDYYIWVSLGWAGLGWHNRIHEFTVTFRTNILSII